MRHHGRLLIHRPKPVARARPFPTRCRETGLSGEGRAPDAGWDSAPRPQPALFRREPWRISAARVPPILQRRRELWGWPGAWARGDLASGNSARDMSVDSSTFHPHQLRRALGELELPSCLITEGGKGKACSLVADTGRSRLSALTQPVLLLPVPVPKRKEMRKKKKKSPWKVWGARAPPLDTGSLAGVGAGFALRASALP